MGKASAKISIIIPIYNAEKYLNQTLYSVVNQTFKDIEIICIDDCSRDHSREILEKFSSTDQRIRCIYQEENAGVGIARKMGVSVSTGEYIMFLDADDGLKLDACGELYRSIVKERVDILQFGTSVTSYGNIGDDTLENLEKLLAPYSGRILSEYSGRIVNACFSEEKFGFTLWNKIYRGDIVRHAMKYYCDDRFDIAEDLYLFFLIGFFAKSYASKTKKY